MAPSRLVACNPEGAGSPEISESQEMQPHTDTGVKALWLTYVYYVCMCTHAGMCIYINIMYMQVPIYMILYVYVDVYAYAYEQ
jgi:hypothetical protein